LRTQRRIDLADPHGIHDITSKVDRSQLNMPTPRRSTGGARGQTGPSKGQSTISFAHRVTKSVPKDTKKDILSPSEAKVDIPAEVKPAKEEVEEPKLEEPEEEEEEEEEETSLVDPETHAPEKSEAELKAEKISDAQINKYWKAIEKERVAPRVHQQDLTVSEKVLRYFDVNSRFGVRCYLLILMFWVWLVN
jgi:DNA polymerase delta subunit 4